MLSIDALFPGSRISGWDQVRLLVTMPLKKNSGFCLAGGRFLLASLT
jgi:hypothetical protein